jgi:hypothetical protein
VPFFILKFQVVDESYLMAIVVKQRFNFIATGESHSEACHHCTSSPHPKTVPDHDYEHRIQAAKEGYLNGRFKTL